MQGKKLETGKVLLVDDDALISINEKAQIEEAGFHCDHSKTVKKAWSLLNRNNYNLIILDHDLQDGKGIHLIKSMLRDKITVPIIYISAAQATVLREIEKIELVKAVLRKPVSLDTLLTKVKQFCNETVYSVSVINENERRQLLENVYLEEK